jgi:hypothetical protein
MEIVLDFCVNDDHILNHERKGTLCGLSYQLLKIERRIWRSLL